MGIIKMYMGNQNRMVEGKKPCKGKYIFKECSCALGRPFNHHKPPSQNLNSENVPEHYRSKNRPPFTPKSIDIGSLTTDK